MAEGREPTGLGFKIFAILGILFFVALVAGLITTYDSGGDVATVAPATSPAPAPAPAASAQATGDAPVGAVATGGGGMADAGGGIAMPVFVGLAALTILGVSGVVLRRQAA